MAKVEMRDGHGSVQTDFDFQTSVLCFPLRFLIREGSDAGNDSDGLGVLIREPGYSGGERVSIDATDPQRRNEWSHVKQRWSGFDKNERTPNHKRYREDKVPEDRTILCKKEW